KIDVEGHELSTLSGFGKYLNADFIDFIQFEYGGANLDSHTNLLDFYNLLTPIGFKIAKVMSQSLELREYSPRMDNFVYSNYVAISGKLLQKIMV
ncbi:MAG: methyltransferase FkbM, partial [Candidatus Yonathbacteria bacterium CG_4_10_14_0_8_um_filter_43_17]